MEGGPRAIATTPPAAKDEAHEMLRSLTPEEWERVSILQQLLATANQPDYGKRQRSVAQKLGMTDRNVQLLLRQLREEGVESNQWCGEIGRIGERHELRRLAKVCCENV